MGARAIVRVAPAAGLLLAAFAYLLTGVGLPAGLFDEGFELTGAMRVLAAEIPYRDFWYVYAPGELYMLAGLFRLCGPSILAARVLDTALRALLALTAYGVARRLAPRGAALAAWLVVTLWLGPHGFYSIPIFSYPVIPALVAVNASVLCLLAPPDHDERRLGCFVAAGVLAGLATTFRQDFGAYALAVEAALLAALALASRPRRWSRLVGFAAGAGMIVGPVALALVRVVDPAELAYSLVVWPAVVMPGVRELPFPALSLDTAPFYLPLGVYLGSLVAVAATFRRGRRGGRREACALTLVALLGLSLLNHARIRPGAPHFLPTFVLAVPLGAALLARVLVATGAMRVVAIAATAAVAGLLLGPLLWARPLAPSATALYHLPRARGIPVESDQAEAVRYLQERVAEGEPIFVGAPRHDRLVLNDASFYFLAARDCATGYHELDPGSVTTLPVQERIVHDLERRDVRYVVIFSGFDGLVEPNQSAVSSGVHVLDDFVRTRFRPEAEFGRYVVWRRP